MIAPILMVSLHQTSSQLVHAKQCVAHLQTYGTALPDNIGDIQATHGPESVHDGKVAGVRVANSTIDPSLVSQLRLGMVDPLMISQFMKLLFIEQNKHITVKRPDL